MPPEYHGLRAMVGWAEDGRDWPRIGSDHPAYFYSLRATDTPDRDLVPRARRALEIGFHQVVDLTAATGFSGGAS